jgi:protein-S-isoprenylcysteine O-methyltransferase Ste14
LVVGVRAVHPAGADHPAPGAASWTLPTGVAVAGVATEVVGFLVMVVAATALGRGLTAAPLPNKHAQLRSGRLYGYVRHPIYSGLLLFAVAEPSRIAAVGSRSRAYC